MENYFTKLNAIDVSAHVEQKNGLSYLAWAWSWGELKKRHPNATYTIYENKDGWNYHSDGTTCWVKTGVTVDGLEHIEYLPVMDHRNKSIPLNSVTSFDVNKAIQRSLTKAVARHGLGLYIYAGEDLPESEQQDGEKHAPQPTKVAQQANTPSRQENRPQAKQTAQMTLEQALAFTAKGGKYGGKPYRDINTSHLEWRAVNMTGEAQEAAKLVLAYRSGEGDTSVIDSLPQISDDDMPF